MKQLALPIAPAPADGFDALRVGANAEAVSHLLALASAQAPAPPVYLWGASGTGKTRLLRALAAARRAAGQVVDWFDAGSELPWTLDEHCRLVVVDRCEALDEARQRAAFALFIGAGSQGAQWAAAGRLPPVDLALRDDLRSRLGWGPVFALRPLSEAETRAALRHEAGRRGIALPDAVLDYLLARQERDLAHLMALLDRIDGFALAEQRAVTVPLLRKLLAEGSP